MEKPEQLQQHELKTEKITTTSTTGNNKIDNINRQKQI